jgi:phospholipid/cholesterol/gamma-HCH transport system permease protein
MADSAANFDIDLNDEGLLRLVARGDWRARFLRPIDGALRDFADDSVGRDIIIDMSGVERLDTAGAMVLQRTLQACQSRTEKSRFVGADDAQSELLEQIENHLAPCHVEPHHRNAFLMVTERLGEGVANAWRAALELQSFIGNILVSAASLTVRPRHIRWRATVHHMEAAGLDALPIVGLMAFMIGAVIAFMGAKILQLFNAEILTVQLVGISVLREFGVLLAAILVAGRSGSAFTAQIGSMKIREEIDAMRVLGLDPIEVLVLPRVFALVIMLPVLAFCAAMLGLTGGGLVAWLAMDIPPALFVAQLEENIALNNFWVGMIKAPFFAFIIAVIGCFQGMEVRGSAESLGQRTTLSVVQSLFLVIVIDAFFAMFFLEIDF